MFTASQEELQTIINQLQRALSRHDEWFTALNRRLICKLPHEPDDLLEDAHRRCGFGHWLYHAANNRLREHPAFLAIEAEHCRMHRYAGQLVRASESGSDIPVSDYDRFDDSLQQLRFELAGLIRELQDTVYNLDPLTGTNTRIGMLTKLREQQELVRREVQYTSVAMMDLDCFKSINDRYGHPLGDQVLISSARFLLEHLRIYDSVFRYGGEEFVVVMPATTAEGAERILERLREGIASTKIPLPHEGELVVTASFGLTLLDPDAPVEQSIARADRAMYAAKEAGRNCIRVWNPEMDELPVAAG